MSIAQVGVSKRKAMGGNGRIGHGRPGYNLMHNTVTITRELVSRFIRDN